MTRLIEPDDTRIGITLGQQCGAHASAAEGVNNQRGISAPAPPRYRSFKGVCCMSRDGLYPGVLQVPLYDSMKIRMNVLLITVDYIDHGLRRRTHLVIIQRQRV